MDGVLPAWRRNRRRAGWRLRVLREGAGWSQLDLEARSGIRHETISHLELGHRAPAAETVRKLARALGVAPAQFVAPEALPPPGLTLVDAARLAVPPGRVREWVAQGTLAGVKVSGRW